MTGTRIDRTNRPLILGGSVSPFGRHRDGSHWRDWVRRAVTDALADAVVVASETDFLSLQVNPGPVILDDLGMSGLPVVRVEAGGASGGAALRIGVQHILSGAARRVLVVGFEAAAGHLDADGVQFVYGLSFDAETDGMARAQRSSSTPSPWSSTWPITAQRRRRWRLFR